MKMKQFDKAIGFCNKALVRQQSMPAAQQVKALYRRADAERSLGRVEECLDTLGQCLELQPENAAAKTMHQQMTRELALQKKKQARVMNKMLDCYKAEREVEQDPPPPDHSIPSGVVWKDGDLSPENMEKWQHYSRVFWVASLGFTLLNAVDSFAQAGICCLHPEATSWTVYFFGVSSTMEQQWICNKLVHSLLLSRMPNLRLLRVVLVGFNGSKQGKDIEPDPNAPADGLLAHHQYQNGQAVVQVWGCKGLWPAVSRGAPFTIPDQMGGLAFVVGDVPGRSFSIGERVAVIGRQGSMCLARSLDGLRREWVTTQYLEIPKPDFALLANAQLAQYFNDWFAGIVWLVDEKVPTAVIGMSSPDKSWEEDDKILSAMGCDLKVEKQRNRFPMVLEGNEAVRKNEHFCGFKGGLAKPTTAMADLKLMLLAEHEIMISW